MGGKGRKRREKNYRAAHGGGSRLPPPPAKSSIDAIPSKLRQLMAFTEPGPGKPSKDSVQKNGRASDDKNQDDKRRLPKDKPKCVVVEVEKESDDEQHSDQEKRKKKRKRNQVEDLRFETENSGVVGSKRKERRKKRQEERKRKNKKRKEEDDLDLPQKEHIRFGDVVQAPPKLVTVPKGFKSSHDASKERLRLKAIEAYRNQRKWTSRPGVHAPPLAAAQPTL